MLTINVPSIEYFDDNTNIFFTIDGGKIELEHSLISISKWESKWKKPFLSKDEKTNAEVLDYIRCMTITKNVNPDLYKNLTDENIKSINKYIEDPMTATTFRYSEEKKKGEVITSELIYYWMITWNIPIEFQKWHLNRLLTLIRICAIKNSGSKKMSSTEIMKQNSILNAARRKKLNSKG